MNTTRTPLIHLVLALILCIALAGAYAFWFIAVGRADVQSKELVTQIREKEAQRERTAEARAALTELASEEAFVRARFVQKEDIVSFLEELEDAGVPFGAQVAVASVTDGTATSEGRIVVALSIEGSFEAVMHTLGVIEHGPYAIATQNLTLNSTGEGTWTAVGAFAIGTDVTPITP